jgi:hypothetical protein
VRSRWGLESVHFTSPKEGWAVGTDFADEWKGVLLHYLNGNWTAVDPPNVSSSWGLHGIHFTSPKEGWAVGSNELEGKGVLLRWTPSIDPQSLIDDTVFNSNCLVRNYQPSFTWTPHGTFTSYTIFFSTSPEDFTSKGIAVAKANLRDRRTIYTPVLWTWKKLMRASYNQGDIRDIYWKIIGTLEDKTVVGSEVRSFRIEAPQAVTINDPQDGAIFSAPPTFEFSSRGNTKFKLEFSSKHEFDDSKKMKAFSITIKDPNIEQVIRRTLTSSQWNAVKKLVGAATGYFRIRAWDSIKRETVSDERSFIVQ